MPQDVFTAIFFAGIPALVGIVALVKGWRIRKEQQLQIAVIFAGLMFILTSLIALFIKIPVF